MITSARTRHGKPAQDKGTLDDGIQRYKYAQSQNSGLELEMDSYNDDRWIGGPGHVINWFQVSI